MALVHLSEVLDILSTRTQAPSILGAQLEGLEVGDGRVDRYESDPPHVIEEVLHVAGVLRCIQALRENGPPRDDKWNTLYPALARTKDRFRSVGRYVGMGYLISAVLTVYSEFGVREPTRGLLSLHRWLSSQAPVAYPPLKGDYEAQVAGFSESTAAKREVSELYADALLAANKHVQSWNAPNALRK